MKFYGFSHHIPSCKDYDFGTLAIEEREGGFNVKIVNILGNVVFDFDFTWNKETGEVTVLSGTEIENNFNLYTQALLIKTECDMARFLDQIKDMLS